jgi:hypothetical protein
MATSDAAQLSEDGKDMVEERAVFDCDDNSRLRSLRKLLAKALRQSEPVRFCGDAGLRPEPGATATLERARERGLDAVAVPYSRSNR